MIPLRVPTAVPHNADPLTSTQQKENKKKKELNREAALNFLATFNVNPTISPSPRLPQPRPTPPEFKYNYEDEYETLAEEAEEFDDHMPPSPFEPDGPDDEPEHLMLL